MWDTVVTSPSAYLADCLRQSRGGIEVMPNAIEVAQYSFRLRRRVEPKDPAALTKGILCVREDATLRRRLIASGFQLVKTNTLERRSREMVSKIPR